MGRFLHHISQVAGELQLPGTIHYIDLHLQRLPAHTGPSQSGHQTHRVRRRQPVRQIRADAQEFLQVAPGDGNPFGTVLFHQPHIRLPTQGAQTTLQISDARLPGVAGNDLSHGVIGDAELGLFQAVLRICLGSR